MMTLNVSWQEGKMPDTVKDVNELDTLLDQISAAAKDRLNCVVMTSEQGAELSLVLGSNETVVGWNGINGNPPYFASLGNDPDVQPVMTCYLMGCHHTEFARRMVIPTENGRHAAREFMMTGKKPQSIKWEEI